MGLETFELQRGAVGDVAELEYISALHQTGKNIRIDGSIQANDIRLFLLSRYGIEVTEEHVERTILKDLGGGGTVGADAPEAATTTSSVLDLVQLVACLLIPTFLKIEQQNVGNPLPHFVAEANPDLLKTVLKIILYDVTGSDAPREFDEDFVRQLLVAYGEHELASDGNLVQEMMRVCNGFSHFDESALAQALTSDVKLLDLANEGSLSTNLNDAFMTSQNQDDFQSSGLVSPSREDDIQDVKRRDVLSQIDVTAGTFRSKPLIILLWVTFAITYFTYSYDILNESLDEVCTTGFEYNYSTPWSGNGPFLVCESLLSICLWLFYFVGTAALGLVFVTLGSTGNSVYCKDWRLPLLGAAAVLLPVGILFAMAKESAGSFLSRASLALALVTAVHHFCHAAYIGWPSFRKVADANHTLLASSVYDEMKLKMSAALKMNALTQNALKLVEEAEKGPASREKYYSKILQSFAKNGSRTEQAGGLRWGWTRILFSGRDASFAKEGIWISARLIASNVAQFIVALYILVFGSRLLSNITEHFGSDRSHEQLQGILLRSFNSAVEFDLSIETVGIVTSLIRNVFELQLYNSDVIFGCDAFTKTAEEVLEEHCTVGNEPPFDLVCDQSAQINYLCPLLQEELTLREQFALLAGSGIEQEELQDSILSAVNQATASAVDSLYPSSPHMVLLPAALAILAAFITVGYLAMAYMPSATSTILKLRRGAIPTLRDPRFFKFRETPDLVAILTGSLFWGALGSGLVVGGIIGLLAFFFVWQGSVIYAQRFLAFLVGFLGITLIRVLYLRRERKKHFRSLYREQPRRGNLLLSALEWAYFSLTAGFIIVRMLKLLLCAAVNVGRIDIPFLAPGVGRIGNIELDHYHLVHMQDVLIHEAHRHPYIEQLGVVYMLKLRHGKHFGSRAGSCWRMIFVQALMPWLQRYRMLARPALIEGVDQNESLPGSFLHPTQDHSYLSDRGFYYPQDGNSQLSSGRVQQLEEKVRELERKLERSGLDLSD